MPGNRNVPPPPATCSRPSSCQASPCPRRARSARAGSTRLVAPASLTAATDLDPPVERLLRRAAVDRLAGAFQRRAELLRDGGSRHPVERHECGSSVEQHGVADGAGLTGEEATGDIGVLRSAAAPKGLQGPLRL